MNFDDEPSLSSVSLAITMHRMPAHRAPSPATGVGDLAQQRNHTQFFHQRGVEGNFVQAIEDLPRRTRRALSFDRVDCTSSVSCESHSRTNGVMVGFPEKPPSQYASPSISIA